LYGNIILIIYMDIYLCKNVQNCFTRRIFRKCCLAFVSYVDHLIFLDREVMIDKTIVAVRHNVLSQMLCRHVSCNVVLHFG
jgi:hypothetical protein